MDEFVDAYAKSTGEKHTIPRKWLGHPVLGKDFELTPSARAKSRKHTASDHQASPEGGPTDTGESLAGDQIHLESPADGEKE